VFPERRVPLCLRQAALPYLPRFVADRASLLGCLVVKERGSLVRGGSVRVRRSLPFEPLAVPVGHGRLLSRRAYSRRGTVTALPWNSIGWRTNRTRTP
jgi:hypothetical protein